jgi:hypothetical protein
VTRPAQHASPPPPRRPTDTDPAAQEAASPQARRPGRPADMTQPPPTTTQIVEAATATAATSAARHERLWAMTREQRIAAFCRGELTFSDCLAWSRRYPDEPPTGPCGEYLYILATDPDWLGEA